MPTQVAHPWRATLRTMTAVLISAMAIYLLAIPIILDGLKDYLPEGAQGWLMGSVAFVTALSGVITRVMALPAVNEALTAMGLGASPDHGRHEATDTTPA